MNTMIGQIPSLTKDTLPKVLQKIHLRYTLDIIPGFTRKQNDKDFIFLDRNKKQITDTTVLERLQKLAIPPAWTHVWISPYENSHLQATGRDEKGRKQYIYHEEWVLISQQNKFNQVIFFGQLLPHLRATVEKDMNSQGLTQKKVLATIAWLLDKTYIRIGNEEYAKENEHFGLTTLHNKHVSVSGSTIQFHFIGKSGKENSVEVNHPRVAKTIRKLEELPGYELFQFINEFGKRQPVDSGEVNEYLQAIAEEEISAKDFRTWGGTVLAGQTLFHSYNTFTSPTNAKKNISSAVKEVATHLRNTPTVARTYYIHPTIFTTYTNNILVPHYQESHTKDKRIAFFSKDEKATLTLLQQKNI